MHKSVSPYHFCLNITFGGIFLHETIFPNVTLVSFKHKNLFTSNMLSDLEDIWSHYCLVAENKSDSYELKATVLLLWRKKLVNKHISKNWQQCCLKKINILVLFTTDMFPLGPSWSMQEEKICFLLLPDPFQMHFHILKLQIFLDFP